MEKPFQQFANIPSFFTEKRFVYEGPEGNESGEPIKTESGKENGGSSTAEKGGDMVMQAKEYCSRYKDAFQELHCKNQGNRMKPAEEEIKELWDKGGEFPGRDKLAENLYKKIAKSGMKEVTEDDIAAFTKKWLADNPNELEIEGGSEKAKEALETNRLADAVEAVAKFLNKKPDLRNKALIEMYIYVFKYPKHRDIASAQKVMDRLKNEILKDRKLMAFLPNLKSGKNTDSTAIATRPSVVKEQ